MTPTERMLVSPAKYCPRSLVDACLRHFLAIDGIGILHDSDLLRRDFTHDAYAESGAGEWLAEYQVFRNAKL